MALTAEKHGNLWWIGGQTYPVRDVLRENGAKWSPKRKQWWHTADVLPPAIATLVATAPVTDAAHILMPPAPAVPDVKPVEPAPPPVRQQTLVLRRETGKRKADARYALPQAYVGEVAGAKGQVFCLGAAWRNNQPVYLSLAGTNTAVESVWAKLALGEQITIMRYADESLALKPSEGGTLKRYQTKLMIGLDHMILVHDSIVAPVYAERGMTYVLYANDAQAAAKVGEHVANLVRVATFPQWHAALFAKAFDRNLLWNCYAVGGVRVIAVALDREDWTDLVREGVRHGWLVFPEA